MLKVLFAEYALFARHESVSLRCRNRIVRLDFSSAVNVKAIALPARKHRLADILGRDFAAKMRNVYFVAVKRVANKLAVKFFERGFSKW